MSQQDLLERDRAVIWHPFTQSGLQQDMLPVARAKGATIYLNSGEELLDGISSWWCNLHGHGHPAIVEAARKQCELLDHVLFAGCTHEPAVQLAERLLQNLPGKLRKIFYSDNGSTAVEVALKMAVQWWHNRGEQRSTIVSLENSYHGDTFGAMAAGARCVFTKPFDSMLFKVEHISTAGSDSDISRLERLCRTKTIAAFIFEPRVQGAGGMCMYSVDVLKRYITTCQQHGVLCIADEVMTGFGRTGPLFASAELCPAPNIVCLSKGLTNGSIPLAVTACSQEIFEGFISNDHSRTFFHGHTYTGNPIAAAIALASLELTLSEECSTARARIHGAHAECASVLRKNAGVSDVRLTGTILAFDLYDPASHGYLSSVREVAMKFFRKRGVLLRPLGNTFYCMPPYCTTEEQLAQIHTSMVDCARELTH